ncbi:MAG TPA: AAA family ATPase [Candidatus Eremiobacteraceae bacterium]|jgi:DNA-binding CsgD family transcriptional regulator/tetratricopeptide (TPR) repeat protein
MISSPITCRRFVGRRPQLELLKTQWRASRAGRGATVLVAGDAGLGKSRLVREFCDSTVGENHAVAFGECLEYARGPFAPFVEVLRALNALRPDALRDALAVRRILAPLIPEYATAGAPPLEVNRRQQFDAYVEALERLLGPAGAVIVIEDVHWADEGTLGLLQHLVGAVPDLPLLLIVTHRSDELDRNHRLVPAIAKIARKSAVFQTRVERFDDEEMDEWLGEIAIANPRLSREALQQARHLAEGNPLFAEELITHAVGGPAAELPLTLREAVLERLRPLPRDARLVLVVAAVVGERFDPDIVAEALRRPVADVLEVLRRARDLGLVVQDAGNDSLRFRHALMREIFYRELLAPEARSLHARIAAALELRPDAATRPVELAHHFWEARDQAGAARYSEAAGNAAQLAGAHEDAAAFFERALEFEHGASADQARLYEKLAGCLDSSGLAERAARAYDQAIEHYRAVGMSEKLAEMLNGFGRQQALLGDLDASIATSETALDILGDALDSPVRIRVLYGFGLTCGLREEWPRALGYLDEALATAASAGSRLRANMLAQRGIGLALTGKLVLAQQAAEESLAAANDTAEDQAIVNALLCAGIINDEAGNLFTAIEMYDRAASRATESLLAVPATIALLNRAYALFLVGDVAAAAQAVSKAYAASRRLDLPLVQVLIEHLNILSALRAGKAALADYRADESAIDNAMQIGQPYSISAGGVFAEYFGRLNRMEEAHSVFSRALDTLRAPTRATYLLVYAAQFARAADVERLRTFIEPWAAAQVTSRGQAYLAYLDGHRAVRRGDRQAAIRHALDAAQLFAVIEHPFPQALSLELAGETSAALDLYRQIGASRDAHRLDAMLAPKGRRGRRAAGLSGRERDVARLVTLGKSNKTIAAELSISERTVENHVTSALKKFGVTSRTELAARLAHEDESVRR